MYFFLSLPKSSHVTALFSHLNSAGTPPASKHASASSLSGEEATHRCTHCATEGLPLAYKFMRENACKEEGKREKNRNRGEDLRNRGAEVEGKTGQRGEDGKKTKNEKKEEILRRFIEVSSIKNKQNKHEITPSSSSWSGSTLPLSLFLVSQLFSLSLVAVSRSSLSQPLEAIPPPQNHLYHHRETPKHTRNRTPLSGEAVAMVAVTVT